MEIGIGIHGEPGRFREPLDTAAHVVDRLATAVADDLPLAEGDRVLAFVNGMGGTPLIELYIVYRELQQLPGGARRHASSATSSATTSPRSRWPAARSRCCAWTTS